MTGRPEVWQTIQQVLELLWNGGDEGDIDGGLGTAQQILDAADITIPSGDLATGGVYDSLGAHYSLPEHIVSDPDNIAELPTRRSNEDEDKSGEEENLDEDEILRRRQEKGKAVINAKDLVTIRVKVSAPGETALKVTISKQDNVRIVSLKILEEANASIQKLEPRSKADCLNSFHYRNLSRLPIWAKS